MKFNKKILTETLNRPNSGKKVFTEGKKQNVLLSEEQLDRLISQLQETREKTITRIIKESYELIRKAITNEGLELSIDDYSPVLTEDQSEWSGGRNPGVAAAEGLENVINGIKKAYDMVKDSDTRKKLANSITKLGNFMTYTAELVGSGTSQRNPRSYDQVSNPLPHPEFEELEESEDDVFPGPKDGGVGRFLKSKKEGKKPDFLDLDKDGDKEESMKKASQDMKEDSGHDEAMNYGRDEGHDDKELYDLKHDDGSEDHIDDLEDDMHYDHIHDSKNIEESQDRKEKIIQEEIKRMKRIIKPIAKI